MDLKDKAQKILDAKVLVIGDLMLDRFTYGDVIRISPEAPVPILHVKNEESYLGGAGNVARNISALIGNSNSDNIFMIGVIGKDKSADIIIENINYANISSKGIVIDDTRSTITKTRIVAGTQQIVRIDEEDTSPFSSNIVKNIEKAFMDNVDNYNVVIISDYNKGVITKQLSKKIIDTCNKKNKAVLVDPAIKHFSFYKKATLMTPNLKEAVEGAESKSPFYEFDAKAIKVLGENIIKKLSLSKLMITLGANGMALFDKDIKLKDKNIPYIIPTKAKSVFDVSGAGDTVISVLAMCLSVGLSFKESSEIANAAAGIVVGKRGTSTLSLKELIDVL
ncbi:D-glycero-beta-D-manno-heptose-7-phosphate kinase [Brachyspira hyodysenteriae]|uniref:D-glycero-beta-D-manno-heptose-7-phosphate kinase n=1 Tax=Brachyspira hyodysenteriae TaxID=159 RepID=UPI00063DDA14|nr:D-glycero-beta-D-manno-heptose-7-phosphate kinase [Brachyspira hyodysenteriae]KLI21098.1 ADP-heptose synthase [Brachyspira hyodysenteriae]MBT8720264.1 D-glycero-beta-D-manno-heptose-7-phosphate kinase [Brachyspira hyodysenteriae]MBT8730502.1 D-glycero-beta-D-manno-heptose-7-phosphate kinase [Brachyspira hyodysenteriae]MBT8733584.1 D-glycero-beta-D-manno-heptose-7-phosphate kinase [Brachyspira hyodysenteriae]MBT8735607.1 D-glycero-beta-D-manno-heptose-7-phosphate kinase [Brachyspira hyodysen